MSAIIVSYYPVNSYINRRFIDKTYTLKNRYSKRVALLNISKKYKSSKFLPHPLYWDGRYVMKVKSKNS